MNWDRVEGNWKQLTGNVKQHWGRLNDDAHGVHAGEREYFAGKIQERFGISMDEMDRQVSDWENRMNENRMREITYVK